MSLSEHWLAFCKPYLDRMMEHAKWASDVSYADYQKLQKKYKDLYK